MGYFRPLSQTKFINDANLVSYYKLEDTSDSKGSNTLTNNGSTSFNSALFANGADFGTSNSTKSLSNPNLETIATDFSYSIWFKISTSPSSGTEYNIVWCPIQSGKVLSAVTYKNNSGTLQINNLSYSGTETRTTYDIDLGTTNYHHLVWVFHNTANTYDVYLNGIIIINGVSGQPKTGSYDYDTTFGASGTSTNCLSGLLDDISVFSRALSAGEVAELYQSMTLGEYLPNSSTKLLLHLNGSSADSSGNNNNGTDTAITYSQANGKFGQGAGLGVSSIITIPTQTYFNLQSAFTISAWVYQTSNGTSTSYEEDIISKDDRTTNNRSWHFIISGPMDTQGRLRFLYNVVSNTSVYSTGTISLNTWTNVMIISTQGTYTFYINGVNAGSGNTNITPAYQGTSPLYLGLYTNDIYAESMIGNEDEVIIENRAWSASEVKKYYTFSKGRFGII